MGDTLTRLSQAGVSIWLDDLSRVRLSGGTLAGLVADQHVVGVTTNPTIIAKAITDSDAYDPQIYELGLRGVGVDEALRAVTAYDVRWARDVLRPVYDATGGIDGRVSIEVDPRIAHDAERTVAEARALWWQVDRPNLFVKTPAAKQGLAAISDCLAEGISINVTLIFSLARYAAVVEAFLSGLERAHDAGHDLAGIASVASFFVSRVDTEIDAQLDEIGTPEATAFRGRAAIANARLAYQHHEEVLLGQRWQALAGLGARPQRPLWASTGVKDPAYADTHYVVDLIAAGVVNTMPEVTLRAVAEHGDIPATSIRDHYAEAQQVLDGLAAIGVDYDRRGAAAGRRRCCEVRRQLGSARQATRDRVASARRRELTSSPLVQPVINRALASDARRWARCRPSCPGGGPAPGPPAGWAAPVWCELARASAPRPLRT
jgi:transaldolase